MTRAAQTPGHGQHGGRIHIIPGVTRHIGLVPGVQGGWLLNLYYCNVNLIKSVSHCARYMSSVHPPIWAFDKLFILWTWNNEFRKERFLVARNVLRRLQNILLISTNEKLDRDEFKFTSQTKNRDVLTQQHIPSSCNFSKTNIICNCISSKNPK